VKLFAWRLFVATWFFFPTQEKCQNARRAEQKRKNEKKRRNIKRREELPAWQGIQLLGAKGCGIEGG
jgi:hypothetical protein